MRLTLEALQANDGDCLLLHYARTGAPTAAHPRSTAARAAIYRQVLRPRHRSAAPRRHARSAHGHGQPRRPAITSPASSICSATGALQEDGGDAFCRIERCGTTPSRRCTRGRPATVQSAAVGAALGGVAPRGPERTRPRRSSRACGRAPRCATSPSAWASSVNEGALEDLVRAPEARPARRHRRPGLSLDDPRSARRAAEEAGRGMAALGADAPGESRGAGRRLSQQDRRRTSRASCCCSKPHAPTARRRCACS